MKDYKTTIMGVLTIVAALAHAAITHMQGQPVNTAVLLTALSTGIGLIMAKDSVKQ